ncbi:MAG: hypothetical protein ACTMII_07960 [Brachybacterium sp.]
MTCTLGAGETTRAMIAITSVEEDAARSDAEISDAEIWCRDRRRRGR